MVNREAERKRLVELIDKELAEYISFSSEMVMAGNSVDTFGEFASKRFLDNGIFAPSCKVGQTLYLVRQEVQKVIEVIVTAIIQRKTFQYAEVLIVEDNRKSLITLAYWGDRLFPTREQAEQALKGGEDK